MRSILKVYDESCSSREVIMITIYAGWESRPGMLLPTTQDAYHPSGSYLMSPGRDS